MGLIGRQFGRPSGLLGRLAGRFMAQNNADLNDWIIRQLTTDQSAEATKVIEVGSGPGVGTRALLATFPYAHVLAVDPSPAMQRQLVNLNRAAARDGRLSTVTGDLTRLADIHDADIVMAVHVLYFWPDPLVELRRCHRLLRPGGTIALGYQLRRHMPTIAQRGFPASGHRVIESDDEVHDLLGRAGFQPAPVRILGNAQSPNGRLLLARRR